MLVNHKYLSITILISLALGFLYYYFLRNSIVGLSCLGIEKVGTWNFEWNAYVLWFPTLIHPFLFSLFSWWAMGFTYAKTSVLFWMSINFIAEIGQGIEKSFFNNFPSVLKNYFQQGTFDYLDVLSIIFGAIFAYLFILKFKKELV